METAKQNTDFEPETATSPVRRETALLAGQKRVLEMVATGAPLGDTLAELIRFVEMQEEGLRCGILALSDDGKYFQRSYGETLPDSYHRALAGAPVTPPYLGPCGEAANQGLAVAVPDIANDERWSDTWRELVLSCGLATCRSTPVRGSDGRVIASFAMYYDRPHDPNPAHPQLIEIATHLAGIALEKDRSEDALRRFNSSLEARIEQRTRELEAMKEELRRANEYLERRVVARTAQLQESERHFRELLEALPAAIYMTDAAGRITYYNQAACDFAGRGPTLGSDEWCVTWRLYWPDGRPMPHDQCPMAAALKEDRAIRGEEAIAERPDGTRVSFIPYPTPLHDPSGRLIGAVNMLVDITERKRAEALAACQKQALQMLGEGAPLTEILEFLIRAAERHAAGNMLGSILPLNEAGTHFERGIGPSLPNEFNAAVAGVAVSSGLGICCDAVARREPVVVPDIGADPRWAQFAEFLAPYELCAGWSSPIIGSDGTVLGTFANYYRQPRDPTPPDLQWVEVVKGTAAIAIERRRSEHRLREREEWQRTLIASSPLAIVVIDPDANVRLWNPAAAKLFGWTEAEVLGRRVPFVPENRIAECVSCRSAATRGEVFALKTQRSRRDGSIVDVSMTAAPLLDKNGEVSRIVVLFEDDTERRRSEAAIRQSEERFRALISASSDAVYSMSPDWSEMRQLIGGSFIPDTEHPSAAWLEKYIDPDDRSLVMREISEAIRAKSIFELEHRVRRIDGSLGWTFSRAMPLLDANGEITEWIGTASDVTERKRAEILRTAQNRVLELTIRDTPLGEVLQELVRAIEAQSPRILGSILLLDDDGIHLRHGAAPSLPDAYNQAIDGLAVGPRAGSCGTAAYRRSAVYVPDIATDPLWTDFRDLALAHGLRACWSTPILTGHGEVLGTFAMYYCEPREPVPADLELVDFVIRSASLAIERRRAEAALHRLNETLEQRVSEALAERKIWADIFESTDAIICVVGPDLRFLAANRAYVEEFERRYGIRPRVGENLLALLAGRPRDQAAADAIWKRALAGERFTTTEELRDNGRAHPAYETTYGVLRDVDGRITGVFQYARDVSERLRSQAQLAEAEERLRQAQRMEALGQLAGGIAHDFNNVLQAVSGSLSLIQKRAEDVEAVRRMARMASDAAGRGAAITSRLLAFARRGELRAVPVCPRMLLENLREILAPTLGAETVVQIVTAEDLPPLLADKAQLETVLVNLAVNARDAMPGGGTLTISAHPERVIGNTRNHPAGLSRGNYVRLELTDTGTGMDAATLARASEPFFTTKPVGQGTGLGLAMARGFAQQSGGGFAIRSAPRQGTTVTLWFPEAEAKVDGPAQAERPPSPSVPAIPVLVVDDDATVREVLAGQLETLGYRVSRAPDGFAALERLDAGEAAELLVTDYSMPGMNGLKLIEEARRRRPGLPALLVTGYADAKVRLDIGGMRDPSTALLRKPVSDDELASHASMLLRAEAAD